MKVDEIFKVQVPLMTNAPEPLALLYNKNRDVEFHLPVDENIQEMMAGSFKKFFHIKGRVDVPKGICEIEFVKEASNQTW